MANDKIFNKTTQWHIINLKARTNQKPSHYVDAINSLYEKDPLVEVYGKKCISVHSIERCELVDEEGVLHWIKLTITHYTVVDPNAFYNIRERHDVKMDWDKDVVANKKEVELIIIPSVHKVVVKKNAKITLKNIVTYLQNALNRVEKDTFDVTVVVDCDFIQRMKSAHSVISFEAHLSFSNPGHSHGFAQVFEEKIKDLNPHSLNLAAKGTKDNPLNNSQDGLFNAACTLAEQNGTINATIQDDKDGKPISVSSERYPRVLRLTYYINDMYSTLYNEIRTRFFENHG